MASQYDVLHSIKNAGDDGKIRAKKLIADAKLLASEGELHKSLKYFKKAYQFFPTEKIQSRIQRLEKAIQEVDAEEEDENFGFIELDNGLVIFKKLIERLYPHQIEGVKWMYNLYQAKKKGGILADDMGLGKTIQVIAFISAMFDMRLIKNILLVLPLSVIPNWVQEFQNWAPGIRTACFHGPPAKRKAILQQCMMKRSVCITTYGLIITQWQTLGETLHGREFVWDYIILDEGHRIKNPSKTTKSLHSIPSRNRIILTGTPVQNKVGDLWSLMDWVTQGSLLGTKRTFKSNYSLPIERARQRDATPSEIQLGNHMAESLRRLTEPFILRRTKDELMIADKENFPDPSKRVVDSAQDQTVINKQPSFPKLSNKNDFVVWVYLSEVQQMIYRDFLELDSVKAILTSHKSPLVYLTILKKICDHPRLLSTKACLELGLLSSDDQVSEDMDSDAIEECAANRIDNISDETLIKESGKLEFLIQLLLRLREEGHRTLIFSMSRKMLNIIQRILLNKKFKIMRLDGLVTKLSERDKRVKLFQNDPTYDVFLLTTQVGGVGLTLTAADRVVIYDPSWNPASDAQSVDRIYRIGQTKNVVVYRLITCGSVEEKIYRRQVFKNSVIQQSTGGSKDPYRYFTSQDLAELFTLDDVESSATQKQLEELHGHQRNFSTELQQHAQYLHTLKMFGLSDHDLMFTRKPDDFDYEKEMSNQLFNNKVLEAQNRLKIESDQFNGKQETENRWGAFSVEARPKDETRKVDKNEPVYPIEGLSQQLDALTLPHMKLNYNNLGDDIDPDNTASGASVNESDGGYGISDHESNEDDHSNESDAGHKNTDISRPQSDFYNDASGGDSDHEENDAGVSDASDVEREVDDSDATKEEDIIHREEDHDGQEDSNDDTDISGDREDVDDVNISLAKEDLAGAAEQQDDNWESYSDGNENIAADELNNSEDDLPVADFLSNSDNTDHALANTSRDSLQREFADDAEDDALILAVDSPVTWHEDVDRSSEHRSHSSVHAGLDDGHDAILAADSPLPQLRSRTENQVSNASNDDDIPIEIEDSYHMFSDTDNEATELDNSWKEAFAVQHPTPTSVAFDQSREESPLVLQKNRQTRRVIESDDSDEDDNLAQFKNSFHSRTSEGNYHRKSTPAKSNRSELACSSRSNDFSSLSHGSFNHEDDTDGSCDDLSSLSSFSKTRKSLPESLAGSSKAANSFKTDRHKLRTSSGLQSSRSPHHDFGFKLSLSDSADDEF